jgi:uncharacterized membrane protein
MWLIFSLLNAFFESVANAFSKRGAQKIDVLSAAWAQRFFSIFIILPLALITHSFQLVNNTFWIAIITSSLLNALTTILFIRAVKDSPLSLTLPIVNMTPVFLLITSPLMIGEFPKPIGLVGILSTIIGAYILNLSKSVHGIFEPFFSIWKEPGPRLMLLVAFIWSITSNIQKIGVKNSNPILVAFAEACIILILLTIILLFKKISFKRISQNSFALAPIGIASGLSIIFQMIAISMAIVPNVLTVKRTSTLFGTLWGKIFFKEKNIQERLIGTIIMLLGVALIAISS